MTEEVTCSVCGKAHTLDSSELTFRLPESIYVLSEEDRAIRCDISSDLCALDRERLFLRGLLPLPVSGRARTYNVGVWAEVSLDTYRRIHERWDDPNQRDEPRLPGALANRLPLHDKDTQGLRIAIQLTGPRTRPEFHLAASEHPLYREQADGIDEHRAIEYSDRKRHLPAV